MQFWTSLSTNGTAKWNVTEAAQTSSSTKTANATLNVAYSNVDWDFLKLVYGWAAVQYQAWARGELIVSGNVTQHLVLYTDAILEYWVDDTHYFGGDYFTFRKAPPVLHLSPGTHQINIRLVRDVRAFGGILAPTIDVVVHAEQASGTLELARPGILLADVVDGKLASPYGSVFLRNSGQDDVEIVNISKPYVAHTISTRDLKLGTQKVLVQNLQEQAAEHAGSTFSNASSITLVAGQTRPVTFEVSLHSHKPSFLQYVITYRSIGSGHFSTLEVSQNLTHTSIYEPHKMTFLHPGGIASYAMLRPPAKNATCIPGQNDSLPILLGLHGAGLEADNRMVTHALDPVPDLCAFVLYPTGGTPWSGDDWHTWGFTDVEAAVISIPDWIKRTGWQGPDVNINRWIVTGHSNGGQGAWYALTHRPDKILAAAPVSGYASIQKYIPYELWQPADPRRTAVLSAAMNSYRHDMLMPNAHGIPIQQQHGEVDDNVPAYNSRLLAQQLFLSGVNSSYNEVRGHNHWWDTVMTTPELVDFYYTQTNNNDTLPRKLEEFEIVVGDPGDMGPKGGIRVLQLEDPDQYGRVAVQGHAITTSNVLRLEFDPSIWHVELLTIDGVEVRPEVNDTTGSSATIIKSGGFWSIDSASVTDNVRTRRGRQVGSMTAILRTHGPFIIRHQGTVATTRLALQVSRNLFQYFQADSNIVSSVSWDGITNGTGNVITLALGDTAPPDFHPNFPIETSDSSISIYDSKGTHNYGHDGESVGAAFLRPLRDERLELVLWGSDDEALAQAVRLVPMVSGVGQPDFVVLGERARWKGVEGALALGFFDHGWLVTASSVVS